METKDTIYVIELKFNKSAQEALDQINNKHYADAFALRGKTVEKIGMNFMIDEDKTIVLDVTKTCLIVKKLFDSDFSSIKIIDSKNKILTLLVAYMKLICNLSIK